MSSLDWIKTAYDTLKKANQLEIAEKLMDLREELLEIREKNLKLIDEKKELNEQLELKGKIKFNKGICWIENDEMSKSAEPTPICPQCYQTAKIVNRLPIETHHIGGNYIICKKCDNSFDII